MISIIIPFYNTEKYFEKCLSSIESQTFSDYECLLIDDGSNDSSRKIAQQYVKKDSRFILLNKKHIGYPLCKNLGIKKSRGEYICFIDSDDFVENNYLEKLYNALIETKSDIANCSFIRNSETINEQHNNSLEVFDTTESILSKYFINTYPWCNIYKKSLFKGLKYKNVEALSDTIMGHFIFERAKRTVYIRDRLYHYRVHNESITYNVRNKSSTYWLFRLNVYIEVASYVAEKYPQLSKLASNLLRSECIFCFPHLTSNQILKFKDDYKLQKLLKE